MAEIPDDLQEKIAQLSPVDWCPVEYSSAVLRAISSAKNDPKGSYDDLVECGKFISVEATNTFYKLLLKVVTPGIFLKKMDSFWSRDFKNAGAWEIDVDDAGKSAKVKLADVAGLDHIAPLSEGFIVYVIKAMGYEDVRCETEGWSLEAPGPAEIRYDIRWA